MGGSSRNRCGLRAAVHWSIWTLLFVSCSRTSEHHQAERGGSDTVKVDTHEQIQGLERPIVLLERYPPYSGVATDVTDPSCRKFDSLFRAGHYVEVLTHKAELTASWNGPSFLRPGTGGTSAPQHIS